MMLLLYRLSYLATRMMKKEWRALKHVSMAGRLRGPRRPNMTGAFCFRLLLPEPIHSHGLQLFKELAKDRESLVQSKVPYPVRAPEELLAEPMPSPSVSLLLPPKGKPILQRMTQKTLCFEPVPVRCAALRLVVVQSTILRIADSSALNH